MKKATFRPLWFLLVNPVGTETHIESVVIVWRRRPPATRTQEDALLEQRIQGIHVQAKGRYGAPRIHAE